MPGRPYDRVKRTLDIVVSATVLIVSAPVQLTTAAAVLVTMGRPIFFRQTRPGKDGVIFELVKFRTMREPSERYQTDAERLTSVGRALRSTSLDELPTLWNVLKGDMSIVGPRPLLLSYLSRYSPEQARRHEVRPGITGLAQANGRNNLSWEEKFTLDLKYIHGRSFVLDLRIIAQTVFALLRRTGISQSGHATMPEFKGTSTG